MLCIRTNWRLLPPVFICFAALLLCCCNGETGNQPPGRQPVRNKSTRDLLEAIHDNKIRLKVHGDSSDIITLELNVISSEPISITLGPGYLAKNVEFGLSHDKLIVESPVYELESGKQYQKKVRTCSTSYLPRPPAGRKVDFQLTRRGEDDPLTQVAAYIIKNPGSDEKIAKVAVWAAAENMPFTELREMQAAGSDSPYLTGREYYESMELLRNAGLKIQNLRHNLNIENVILEHMKKLETADRSASLAAIEFLGWFYMQPRAADVLVDVLEKEDDPVLREKAARTLAGCGLDYVTEPLFMVLEMDRVKAVRRAAAFSLVTLGDAGAVPLAIMFLGDEETAKTDAARVCQKLGELVGEGSETWAAKDWELWWLTRGGWDWLESRDADVEKVKKMMEAQQRFYGSPDSESLSAMESENQEIVLSWLRKLHTTQGRKQLEKPAVFEKMLKIGMGTSNPSVALNVAWILRETTDEGLRKKSEQVLIEMLSKKENRPAYRDIISLLGNWRVGEAVEQLLFLLEDKQYGEFAIEALKKITGKDVSQGGREAWEKLLVQHGGTVKPDLIRRIKESKGKELARVLSELGSNRFRRLWSDPEIYEALLAASGNVTEWEQINSFILIITTNKKDLRTQRTLRRMFGSVASFEVKRALITALEQHFPNGDTVSFLLDILDGKDRRLKMAARNSLYEITGAKSPKRLGSKSDWLNYFSKHPSARWGKREK